MEALSAGYGRATVVRDVSMSLRQGECVAVIGHNGAGKSTLLLTIMGLVPQHGGVVRLEGQALNRLPTARRVKLGMSLVPQGDNVFGDLTIAENLALSAQGEGRNASVRSERIAEVHELFPELKERPRIKARYLSGGQRQMLAIAIALMKRPRILLLDEPSLGLAPRIVRNVFDSVAAINARLGTTIVVVEQNVSEVFRVASRAYVMQGGTIVAEDQVEALAARGDLFSLL